MIGGKLLLKIVFANAHKFSGYHWNQKLYNLVGQWLLGLIVLCFNFGFPFGYFSSSIYILRTNLYFTFALFTTSEHLLNI